MEKIAIGLVAGLDKWPASIPTVLGEVAAQVIC